MKQIIEHNKFIEENLGIKLKHAKKLNISCGPDYRKGWVNVDFNNNYKNDVIANLEKLPLPFKDNSFDYIFSMHTLEHLEGDLVPLMIEFWRILKPNGILEIRVPHFSHYNSLNAFGHKNAFSINIFNLFLEKGFPAPQTLYKKLGAKLKYQRTENGKKLLVKKNFYYYFANLINKLADINVNFCERIWCYWVGGFQEMQIYLQK